MGRWDSDLTRPVCEAKLDGEILDIRELRVGHSSPGGHIPLDNGGGCTFTTAAVPEIGSSLVVSMGYGRPGADRDLRDTVEVFVGDIVQVPVHGSAGIYHAVSAMSQLSHITPDVAFSAPITVARVIDRLLEDVDIPYHGRELDELANTTVQGGFAIQYPYDLLGALRELAASCGCGLVATRDGGIGIWSPSLEATETIHLAFPWEGAQLEKLSDGGPNRFDTSPGYVLGSFPVHRSGKEDTVAPWHHVWGRANMGGIAGLTLDGKGPAKASRLPAVGIGAAPELPGSDTILPGPWGKLLSGEGKDAHGVHPMIRLKAVLLPFIRVGDHLDLDDAEYSVVDLTHTYSPFTGATTDLLLAPRDRTA